MTRVLSKSLLGFTMASLLVGCGATNLVSTPIENIDTTPLAFHLYWSKVHRQGPHAPNPFLNPTRQQ